MTSIGWDVNMALADVCREIGAHIDSDSKPSSDQLRHWYEWIENARLVHLDLAERCEDLVETGVTPERLRAVEQFLAYAQGRETYWPRKDRW